MFTLLSLQSHNLAFQTFILAQFTKFKDELRQANGYAGQKRYQLHLVKTEIVFLGHS